MKRTKKTSQLLRIGEAEKWQRKFTQILEWIDEPASASGSIAQRLHRIRQAKELLAPHEREELYRMRSVYVSVFYDHLEEVLNAYRADLLSAVKVGALATSTLGACAFLANRWTNYNLDLMQLYAFVEKVEAAFPALFKQLPSA